jgi:hypothetical protein
MTRRRRPWHAGAACAACVLASVLSGPTPAGAQKDRGRVDDPRPSRGPNAAAKAITTRTTGALVVVSGVAGASVELVAIGRSGKASPRRSRAADAAGNATFPSLAPGTYRVVVTSADHDPAREEVRVVANKPLTLSVRPSPRYGHIVLAGPGLGADASVELDGVPIPAKDTSAGPDGSLRIRVEKGDHRVTVTRRGFRPFAGAVDVAGGADATVAVVLERERASVLVRGSAGTRVYLDGSPGGVIPETGELELTRLEPGRNYSVRFELEDHEASTRSVRLRAEERAILEATLEPLPTSGPFEATFLAGLAGWDAPGGWRASNGMLEVAGPGLGTARGWRYRGFEMVFGLRLLDASGAAWVIRAQDDKNYYLFVWGGPSGRYPNQLRTYVVRDGAYDADRPDSTLPIIPPLRVGESYRVRVVATGNTVEQFLTPSSTGEEVSVGLFTDVKRSYALGLVGFAAPGGERFQVHGLVVRPTDGR